jgi:hypothetical protein
LEKNLFKSALIALLFAIGSSQSFGISPEPGDLNGQPSFNCSKASTEVEKRICSSSSIAALDVVLSNLYKKILTSGQEEVRISQRTWLKTRSACLDNDPGWWRDPLAECYSDRIRDLEAEYSSRLSDEEYHEVAERILKRIISQTASDGEKFVFIKNVKLFTENIYDNYCGYNPENIVFENDHFLKTVYGGSVTCNGSSSPVSGSIVYCKTADAHFVEGDVWNCRKNSKNIEVLLQTIKNNSFSAFTPNEADWVPREFHSALKSQSKVILYLYSRNIHILGSPYFFSESFLKVIDENLDRLKGVLGFSEQELAYLMSGMKCTYQAVIATEDWEAVFKSEPPGYWGTPKSHFWYGRQFSGCDSFNKIIENEMYTEKELFILFWQRIYSAKSMELAITILDRELQEVAD